MIKEEIIKKLHKNSINLESFGVGELAWKKQDAMDVIISIMTETIGVLGGDVYKLDLNHLKAIGDNWFCEMRDNESRDEFYLRSKMETLKYIEQYPCSQADTYVFSMTFTDQIL